MGFGGVKREPNFANEFRFLALRHEPCDGTAMSPPAPGSIDMLKRLVAFDTTSRNSNLELIRHIQDYLDGHGVRSVGWEHRRLRMLRSIRSGRFGCDDR